MSRTKVVVDGMYRGFKINSSHGGCRDTWLDGLLDMNRYALDVMYEPNGYVVSFEFCEGYGIGHFIDNLNYFYQRSKRRQKTPCKPIWSWKYEVKMLESSDSEYGEAADPARPYHHYHVAIILDGKKARARSLKLFMHLQQQQGVIHQYKVSTNRDTGKVGKSLRADLSGWVYHASYLAKLDTAAPVLKPFSTCRLPTILEKAA